MNQRFLLIRHGKTQGNLERRYLGDLEEPLCPEGIQETRLLADSGLLPPVDRVFSGPAVRCRQTAQLLWPELPIEHCPLVEIDFGCFKGKNAGDLLGDEEYEKWLDSACLGDLPGGDSVEVFKMQSTAVFRELARTAGAGTTALVIHGGNIMAILERLALPRYSFYHYQLPNGGYFLCRYDGAALRIERVVR